MTVDSSAGGSSINVAGTATAGGMAAELSSKAGSSSDFVSKAGKKSGSHTRAVKPADQKSDSASPRKAAKDSLAAVTGSSNASSGNPRSVVANANSSAENNYANSGGHGSPRRGVAVAVAVADHYDQKSGSPRRIGVRADLSNHTGSPRKGGMTGDHTGDRNSLTFGTVETPAGDIAGAGSGVNGGSSSGVTGSPRGANLSTDQNHHGSPRIAGAVSCDNLSPRRIGAVVDSATDKANGSPKFNRQTPWAQVVRGETSSPTMTEQDRSDADSSCKGDQAEISKEANAGGSDNVGGTSKPVWKKPVNGVIEVQPVIGVESWPALSESTKPVPKSALLSPALQESPSLPVSEASASVSQGPANTQNSRPRRNRNNANSSSGSNHTNPGRLQRRGGSSGTGGNGVVGAAPAFSRPHPPPPAQPPTPPPAPPMPPVFPLFEAPYGGMVPAIMDPSFRGPNWMPRTMAGVGNDQPLNQNPLWRGTFGPRPRGDVLHANGYASRRDQNRDSHAPRSSSTSDVHITPQMVPPSMPPQPPPLPPPGFFRQRHPGPAPFIPPRPMRPFRTPMSFDMSPPFYYYHPLPPESFRGVPLPPHPIQPPMVVPVLDPNLCAQIVKQVEYYFSDANLITDGFLKSMMNDEGWVPISLIAGFPRMQSLTKEISVIMESLKASTAVEIQGDKVRRRDNWKKWIITAKVQTDSGLQSPRTSDKGDSSLQSPLGASDEVNLGQESSSGVADKVDLSACVSVEKVESPLQAPTDDEGSANQSST